MYVKTMRSTPHAEVGAEGLICNFSFKVGKPVVLCHFLVTYGM
jgi:hypothetical protein